MPVLSTNAPDCTDWDCVISHTVELQWLEHLWSHENIFKAGVVRANEWLGSCQIWRHDRDIFLIFYNMKVCCAFSLESPQRGDSN